MAQSAAELLEADSGAVTLVVEEGRFLKVIAACGSLESAVGLLIPIDDSLLGWAVSHDAPLVSDNMDADPRSHHPPGFPVRLKTAAIVPLRSADFTVGT